MPNSTKLLEEEQVEPGEQHSLLVGVNGGGGGIDDEEEPEQLVAALHDDMLPHALAD